MVRTRWKCTWREFPPNTFFLFCLWTERPKTRTTVTQSRNLARPKPRGSEPYPDLHRVHVQQQQQWPRRQARADRCSRLTGVGCLGSGTPSTTYKTRGLDGWRVPNLDRSTVFYRPNQTSTPSPPVGTKRPAVSAPDAGGVELQSRPLGTMSGGEGHAGTKLVSSHRSRK